MVINYGGGGEGKGVSCTLTFKTRLFHKINRTIIVGKKKDFAIHFTYRTVLPLFQGIVISPIIKKSEIKIKTLIKTPIRITFLQVH
jgi:hypothetical protein